MKTNPQTIIGRRLLLQMTLDIDLDLILNQMKFGKTIWSCLWNSDKNYTQNSTWSGDVRWWVCVWWGEGEGWCGAGVCTKSASFGF